MIMHQKVKVLIFFNTCPKRAVLDPKKKEEKEKEKFDHYLVFVWALLGLHFLLNVSKTWLANLLTTIFTKKMSDLVCTCSM